MYGHTLAAPIYLLATTSSLRSTPSIHLERSQGVSAADCSLSPLRRALLLMMKMASCR
jgi:hypothetical protein